MYALESRNITLGYDKKIIVDGLDLTLSQGEITVLVGANGCGKSTILRALARLLKPVDGTVYLGQEPLSAIANADIARRLAILPQSPDAPAELSVYQLVKQGRYPHQRWYQNWSGEDEDMVDQALRATELDDLRHQPLHTLSGGQRQRAWIALCLAQNTDIILLDEPTTYLDLSHQIDILELLKQQNQKTGKTIIMVLHDLYLACRYAHRLIAIKNGHIHIQGPPKDVITPDVVQQVFNLSCNIITDPHTNTPICIPHGRDNSDRRNAHDFPE